MLRVADYVINRLYQESVKHLFMVTGRGMLFLSDAVARHKEIIPICMHHEQSCSYAAMAYAQANESVGACMVSTGCASTNAITGVLCAWQDDVPLIVISGQNKLAETTRHTKLPVKTYGQQEADVISLVQPITKYAVMLERAEDVVYELEKALYLAQEGRKGPVWLDIPLDIQNMRVEPEKLHCFVPPVANALKLPLESLDALLQAFQLAKRPVVLIGSGIRSSGTIDALQSFIERYELPLVYSHSAVDVIESSHPMAIGCVGSMAANRAANFAIQNSDLVLVLGCRLTTYLTGEKVDKFARAATIIAVDIDQHEHKKFPGKIDTSIHMELSDFFEAISSVNLRKSNSQWVNQCQQWKQLYPKCEEQFRSTNDIDIYELADVLSDVISSDAVCVTDSGLEEILIPTTMRFTQEQRCLHPVSQGAMGYALPASVGAYCASNKQVVAIIGDGSVMMNIQELQTICHHKLPVKILIVNNDCYAVIRKRQKELFRARTIGTDADNGVSCPDFEKVAFSYDIPYRRIECTSELEILLQQCLATDGPVICEIMAKTDQTYIHSSYRKGLGGKFVQPPIEDQSPFLERDEFLSQMIIEPIDL